jgi:hypothetical protein
LQRRELLYGIVRECMTASGMLSSTYKFKVLSLDSSGRQYLIMIDVPRQYMTDPEHFVNMEGAIARSAKERFEMLVTAVYWRVNDMVSARPSAPSTTQAAAHRAPQRRLLAPHTIYRLTKRCPWTKYWRSSAPSPMPQGGPRPRALVKSCARGGAIRHRHRTSAIPSHLIATHHWVRLSLVA